MSQEEEHQPMGTIDWLWRCGDTRAAKQNEEGKSDVANATKNAKEKEVDFKTAGQKIDEGNRHASH